MAIAVVSGACFFLGFTLTAAVLAVLAGLFWSPLFLALMVAFWALFNGYLD